MIKRRLLYFFSVFILCLIYSSSLYAQKSYDEQQLQVALRTIGHRLLLKSGDSSSRVLPITKEGNRYKIQFEKELDFAPDSLFRAVSSVITGANFTEAFIVEVEDCESGEVVYNYEIDSAAQLEMLPCGGRNYPMACYNIFFTIKELGVTYPMQIVPVSDIPKPATSNRVLYGLGALSLLLIGVFIFIRKRKTVEPEKIEESKVVQDPNLLQMGQYVFNKRSAALAIHGKESELSGKESDLLIFLFENVNKTVERNTILENVWGDEGDYIGRTLDVFISKLRKKLEADSNIKIVNIRGVGYKLIVE